ncbi:alpha-keto acid decarboxylase family protein [Bradyrhizobium sp. INPA01-394B]|uniref:Alpha-keto acid decarboxylase family protein n=1 Tax=Bradyrhizobium campsiandrae TaxID=1729892 RepID=A0ABR7TYC2_9BRAD|nr:thiamine pyrophosphate-binding protein [Bradyrhizobium campsiandrae]MBC9877321.1 alpha-keto acid decarboxylase family protein [Bradyrhizobium campsiandrae]MBC9976611.1 alpha-keto acid decarboxylase family protein [Bradyrhizobium campsiandrae]
MLDESQNGTVASYLIARLEELGIEHLFNVPGSYCTGLLAELAKHSRLKAIFTTYEMEAAYAADAYARIKGFGAMCGTCGVGALSALNGVVGAFVERCPVVVINGSPCARQLDLEIDYGIMFQHSTGRFKADLTIYSQATVATAVIERAEEVPDKIDEVLIACMTWRRPVYIEISQDLWGQSCALPVGKLSAALTPVNPESLSECLDDAMARLVRAQRPVLWVGEELDRWRLHQECADLLRASGVPYVTTLAGKSVLAETTRGFLGVYDRRSATPDLQEFVERADCVIALGTTITDFVEDIVAKDYSSMILASQGGVRIGHHIYRDVGLREFVVGLTQRLGDHAAIPPPWERAALQHQDADLPPADAPMTFDLLFSCMPDFVQGKLVIADNGLSLFGSAGLPIVDRQGYLSQSIWMSIGYSLGASVGAACASAKRPVVLVGDAAFREGPQALSTLVQYKLPAVVCVMNNGIMGIQQFMGCHRYYDSPHGQPDYYNVLRRWNYGALAGAFGAQYASAKTLAEFEQALRQAAVLTDVPILIDVMLDEKDIPTALRHTIGRTAPEAVQANFEAPLLRRIVP